MGKKLIGIAVIAIMLFGVFGLAGCSEKASKYTEAEHIQRVTERIEKRFMTSEYEYTGFEVYPLYNEEDELKYCLVEFAPHGFLYVLIRDEKLGRSMYSLSVIDDESPYAGLKDEQRYLMSLKLESAGSSLQIAAVKREGKFVNLISMEEIEIVDGKLTKRQAEAGIVFTVKSERDL